MRDCDPFRVSDHFRRVTALNPKWAIRCAYCRGTGDDPAPISERRACPVCGGCGMLESDVNPEDLKVCPRCEGNARRILVWRDIRSDGRPNVYGVLRPCFDCGGSGMV